MAQILESVSYKVSSVILPKFVAIESSVFIGSQSGEPMFSLCRKWRNLPDIAKSRDASLDNDLLALSSRS